MDDSVVPVLSGNLERQPRPDRVQRVGQRDGRNAGPGSRHKLVRMFYRQICPQYLPQVLWGKKPQLILTFCSLNPTKTLQTFL